MGPEDEGSRVLELCLQNGLAPAPRCAGILSSLLFLLVVRGAVLRLCSENKELQSGNNFRIGGQNFQCENQKVYCNR